MKKFLFRICIFFVIVFCADFIIGKSLQHITQIAKGGDTKRAFDIIDKIDDDILVLGSSRALHHYDVTVLEDSLGLSVYNCGRDGNGIIFNYGQFKLLSQRYKPKFLIYEITPGYDLYYSPKTPNVRYLGALKIMYDRKGIDSIFKDIDPLENFKMTSGMYRFNKRFIQILSDSYSPQQDSYKGYKPLEGIMNYNKSNNSATPKFEIDCKKLEYLERLIKDAQKDSISIIFAVSPQYGIQHENYDSLLRLCKKYNCNFWDFQNDPDFCNNMKYFKDSSHLNKDGASKYSSKIAHKLKESFFKTK